MKGASDSRKPLRLFRRPILQSIVNRLLGRPGEKRVRWVLRAQRGNFRFRQAADNLPHLLRAQLRVADQIEQVGERFAVRKRKRCAFRSFFARRDFLQQPRIAAVVHAFAVNKRARRFRFKRGRNKINRLERSK